MNDASIDGREAAERRRPVATLVLSILGVLGLLVLVTAVAFVFALVRKNFFMRSSNLQVAAVHYPQDIDRLIDDGHDVNAPVAGQTPLTWAITFRKVESVRLLLQHGADPNLAGADGKPPLASPFLSYSDPPCREILDLMLAAGADPNVHGVFGKTPLHFAVQERDVALIRTLLAGGADPNAVDELARQTPLHAAVEIGDPQLVRELLAAGADVNAEAQSGITPLMIAIRQERAPIVEILLEADANTSLAEWAAEYVEREAGTPEIREMLQEYRSADTAARP